MVIDDYDLVATSSGNPVAPLAGLIPQAMDIGFHIVLARRAGGISRAMFEPVHQGLTDIGTPGPIFSGDRMEGDLVAGVRASELPVGRADRGRPVRSIREQRRPPCRNRYRHVAGYRRPQRRSAGGGPSGDRRPGRGSFARTGPGPVGGLIHQLTIRA